MSKDNTITTTKSLPSDSKAERASGMLPGLVYLTIDIADRGQTTALHALQDARAELRTAVDHGIDLAEKLTTGAFRFAKKVVARIDESTSETLTGVERFFAGTVKSARETTRAAQELATTATAGVTGQAAA
jgi:microcompartment protein CcmL/EutN